jgi:hypothetical protein
MTNSFLPLHTPRADDRAGDPSVVKGTSDRDRVINNPPNKRFVSRNCVKGPKSFPKLIERVGVGGTINSIILPVL